MSFRAGPEDIEPNRGRMFLTSFRSVSRSIILVATVAGLSAAGANTTADSPVDLDNPDTEVESAEAIAAVEAADASAAALVRVTPGLQAQAAAAPAGDTRFRSLFSAWRQMDGPDAQAINLPSRRPVDQMRLTSSFGTRSDPFSGRRARHNGIDIPGATGTPIYATADGNVGRAQRLGGYGNYVEIEHGNAIQTRYGHMSQILVEPGQRVRRGDMIGLVGSTGRSTGPHLHYEVRIAGAPVNPIPFIADDGVMVAAAGHGNVALGGPRE